MATANPLLQDNSERIFDSLTDTTVNTLEALNQVAIFVNEEMEYQNDSRRMTRDYELKKQAKINAIKLAELDKSVEE